MNQTHKKQIKIVVGLTIGLALLATVFGLNWRRMADQIAVWRFNPTTEIAALVTDSGMGSRGQFYFFASHPQLSSSAEFNRSCPKYERMVVLGCYVNGRIFLYNVTDERLTGATTVTAAHEMLHAAYDRLCSSERARVDRLIQQQLDKTTDPRLLGLVEAYDRTEPGQRLNEFHSIFGTEVADLSPELEDHYSKYFNDRARVVAVSEKYQQVFDELKSQQSALESKLRGLEIEITASSRAYDAAMDRLSADIEVFNERAARPNGFSSQAEFAAVRGELMSRQAQLGSDAATINAKINEYNVAVADLNALGVEAQKLQNSLNSRSPGIL